MTGKVQIPRALRALGMTVVLRALGMTGLIAGAAHAQENPTRLETPTGTLYGTLLIPEGRTAPMPVALIIAGSGPTDRDGNTPLLPGKNNSLRMVAEALAANGIASLRYDKRGIAASAGAARSESDLRFTHYVDDAAAWLNTLAADARFSRVLVVGHSEGSLIGIMAAQRAPVERVVSLAGAGRSARLVLEEQLSRNLAGSPLLDEARKILDILAAGRTMDTASPQLATLFRKSVQPYLISWLNVDPAAEIGKLRVPVLVAQGSTDVQISVEDARRLAAGNPLARLEIIEGMNHVLKEVREGSQQTASYSDPALPLHPALLSSLAAFLRQ